MDKFADEIEQVAGGPEAIEAVVIGEWGRGGYREVESNGIPREQIGEVLDWATAKPLLSYNWDNGFGSPKCHAVAVYTAKFVVMVSQYDGATSLFKVHRNPTPHMPNMPGG